MSDRELLEAAAKAAGLTLGAWSDDYGAFMYRGVEPGKSWWNPLTDDGDALRLAVRLGLHAKQFPILDNGFDAPRGMVEVWRVVWCVDDDDPLHVEFLRSGDDRLVATRRAIVGAAAWLAKDMK
jgi:hypothetical protein